MASINARVTVYPRREILDPQGKAIGEALGRLGIKKVLEVRAGKSFEVKLSTSSENVARKILTKICQELLANPVVEDYSFDILAEEKT
jgi:phosphoribosylformylglycinamidine synthase